MTKTKIYIIIAITLVFFSMGGAIKILHNKLKEEKAEKELYKTNTYNLLNVAQIYQTKDSLNVVSAGKLELKLSEYEKYREEDLKLINSLKVVFRNI